MGPMGTRKTVSCKDTKRNTYYYIKHLLWLFLWNIIYQKIPVQSGRCNFFLICIETPSASLNDTTEDAFIKHFNDKTVVWNNPGALNEELLETSYN